MFFNPMSKVIVVIGAQWGDEGKGKIVDLLAEHLTSSSATGRTQCRAPVQIGDRSSSFTSCLPGIVHPGKTACSVMEW
jgi:adenylosuccinate synthase